MPAASEPPADPPEPEPQSPAEPPARERPERPDLPELPLTWRPLGPRVAGAVAGGALLVITTMAWIGFDQQTKDAITPLQRATVVGFFLLGFACLYALGRSRAQARTDTLVVVNGFRKRELAWAQVVAVHLREGAPWVTLDLSDGNALSVMGIQASDGQRARRAVRQLRALVDDSNAPGH